MRRFVGLVILFFIALPFGLSVSGCKKALATEYCNSGDSGPVVGQVASITLSPQLATIGESLSFGQIGQSLSANAIDCKGNAVSVRAYTFATTNMQIADINPSSGSVCAGTWNRNTGGGVPDYTTCTPPTIPPSTNIAYVTASAAGAVSNSIPVYIHPTITSIVLGNPSTSCSTDPATTCCPANSATVYNPVPQPYYQNSCVSQNKTAQLVARVYQSASTVVTYSITSLSIIPGVGTTFTVSGPSPAVPPVGEVVTLSGFPTNPPPTSPFNGQIVTVSSNQATTAPFTFTVPNTFGQATTTLNFSTPLPTATSSTNITCQIGHLSFAPQTASNIVQIDENGVATANQPGSTLITASVSNSSSASSAGFFSTCPPANITLADPNAPGASSVSVNVNNSQPLVATVTDTLGNPITGLSLEFESTTPQTVPAASTVTPVFPGTSTITALCQPGTCNPAPFSQIGYLGNGKPIQSNGITINTAGTVATVLFMASTQSQYIAPMDFSTNLQSSPVKLPYAPNSMVISLDGSVLYLGSPQGLMTVTTTGFAVSGPNTNVPGTVLAISPDGSTLVVTDPTRHTVSLVATSSQGITTQYGGDGTRAVFTPDSQTVYIPTSEGALLTHSNFTNWQTTAATPYFDAVVTVPSVGAYFASGSATGGPGGTPTTGTTDGRSYCSSTVQGAAGTPPTEVNTFAPIADTKAVVTDKLGATNDGQHVLGAHTVPTSGAATFTDFVVSLPTQTACPLVIPTNYFTSAPTTSPLSATVKASSITGVFPTSGQVAPTKSQVAFVTYTGTGNLLPEYLIPSPGAGTLSYITLAGAATAPIIGVWSVDNTTFYTGTSGDNEVHEITQACTTTGTPPNTTTTCVWKDSGQLTPNLPPLNGTGNVPVNLIAQRPKKTTS